MRRILFLIFTLFLFVPTVNVFTAPSFGDLRLSTFASSTASTGDQNPLWVTSNRNGVYRDDQNFQGRVGFSLGWEHHWDNQFRISASLQPSFLWQDDANVILEEAYITTGFPYLLLTGGVAPITRGELPDIATSSGSMSISTNARSIPRIAVNSDGFVPVPFLPNNFIQLNYGLAHGWFLDDRHVQKTLLHEKWLYGRLARDDFFSFHLGLVHHAKWGGRDERDRALPVSWENYWRIFAGLEGGEDAAQFDQDNVAGDHLGIWDVGLSLTFPEIVFHAYHHRFFEDRSGLEWRNGLDGLWGMSLNRISSTDWWPSWFTIEWIHTRHQSGEYHDITDQMGERIGLGGRDSYYHHSAYLSGWTHHSRIIGTPLFIATGENEATRIASNRIIGAHLGISGSAPDQTLKYRVLVTTVLHDTAYASRTIIPPNGRLLRDYHLFGEVTLPNLGSSQQTSVTLGLGYDLRRTIDDRSVGGILSLTHRL